MSLLDSLTLLHELISNSKLGMNSWNNALGLWEYAGIIFISTSHTTVRPVAITNIRLIYICLNFLITINYEFNLKSSGFSNSMYPFYTWKINTKNITEKYNQSCSPNVNLLYRVTYQLLNNNWVRNCFAIKAVVKFFFQLHRQSY